MKRNQWVRYRLLLGCFDLKVIDKQICFSYAPCKKVLIPESCKFLLVDSGIQNPESRRCLDSRTWGDTDRSGGSRGGARRARGPPLFLDQNKARRAEKLLFGGRPPPNLRVWMTAPPLI